MQDFCIGAQNRGMSAFREVALSLGKPIEKALEKCAEDWAKNSIPDWEMIGFCARQQASAYYKINAPSSHE